MLSAYGVRKMVLYKERTKMRKRKAAVWMAPLTFALCVPQALPAVPATIVSEAHSGRTDSNGGHRDNKNKSGLGSYHYHCVGLPAHLHTNGICPYDSNTAAAQADAPAPAQTIPENISMVFDARYYADHNADLYETYGYDEEQLLNHFLTSGMKEGRTASESFNVSVYRENNPDLVNVYGDDLAAYYEHYMSCGHSEGRVCR